MFQLFSYLVLFFLFWYNSTCLKEMQIGVSGHIAQIWGWGITPTTNSGEGHRGLFLCLFFSKTGVASSYKQTIRSFARNMQCSSAKAAVFASECWLESNDHHKDDYYLAPHDNFSGPRLHLRINLSTVWWQSMQSAVCCQIVVRWTFRKPNLCSQ